jgi:hypothetical protein
MPLVCELQMEIMDRQSLNLGTKPQALDRCEETLWVIRAGRVCRAFDRLMARHERPLLSIFVALWADGGGTRRPSGVLAGRISKFASASYPGGVPFMALSVARQSRAVSPTQFELNNLSNRNEPITTLCGPESRVT